MARFVRMQTTNARRARAILAGLGCALGATAAASPSAAGASVRITPERVVVSTPAGSKAVVDRGRARIYFVDGDGHRVLGEVSPRGGPQVVPPVPHIQFGAQTPPPPTRYTALGFLVGTQAVAQTAAGQWSGTLQSVTQSGIRYGVTSVRSAARRGAGVRLVMGTDDPSGRTLAVNLAPIGRRGAIRLSARPSEPAGIATMSDSFAASPGEAFRGFGGRHDSLDQRGHEFYNWLQQENISSGSASGLTPASPGDTTMFPNGPSAAYYVQSSFVSSGGFGFLLDRDNLSHWRMGSDVRDAWQVETAGPALDYVVAPGAPASAVRTLTALTGRQPAPPKWALGSIIDRLVQFPSDPAAQYLGEVRSDLREMKRHHIRVDGYRIEGWQFLPRPELKSIIAELRKRGIHPMLYFRLFVGKDTIGTDSPAAYDEALARGLVATHADGSPYVFTSNFSADGAVIDFTNPQAVAWWKGRIREALELGADGFMQDFGEQVFADMHFHDGSAGTEMHNRLPALAARATREVIDGFEQSHPKRRIWFFTRAGHTGRPGAAAYEGGNFPGDETTDWTRSSGLASLTTDMLNRAIGGAYGYSTDIGGFFDVGPYKPTTEELFLRWAEWAALSPFFRLHGSVLAGSHMPWTYSAAAQATYRRMIRLHLRARPLIQRLWAGAGRTGMPPTRPLWLAYPGDARAAAADQEWMLGPEVLVAPVVTESARSRAVYLPKGCWQQDGSSAHIRGPREIIARAPLGSLPWFKRCGTSPLHA